MKYYVELSNNIELRKVESTLLQKIAKENGYRGCNWADFKRQKYLGFDGAGGADWDTEKNEVSFSEDNYMLVSIEQAIDNLKKPKEEKIILKDENGFSYDVDFGNARGDQLGFIKVSCLEISKETFLKIKKRAGW